MAPLEDADAGAGAVDDAERGPDADATGAIGHVATGAAIGHETASGTATVTAVREGAATPVPDVAPVSASTPTEPGAPPTAGSPTPSPDAAAGAAVSLATAPTDADPDAGPDADTDANPTANPDADPDAETDADTDAEAGAEANVNTEANAAGTVSPPIAPPLPTSAPRASAPAIAEMAAAHATTAPSASPSPSASSSPSPSALPSPAPPPVVATPAGAGATYPLHILCAAFHHRNGPQIEYVYPPLPGMPPTPVALDDPTAERAAVVLPDAWQFLPFICLPDGGHASEEAFIYFHLPPVPAWTIAGAGGDDNDDNGGGGGGDAVHDGAPDHDGDGAPLHRARRGPVYGQTLFGLACYRQMPAADLLQRPSDVTRSMVQKAVVVLASDPVLSGMRDKLGMVTAALFAQRDFSDLRLLPTLYTTLAFGWRTASLTERHAAVVLGLGLRDLVARFRHKVLVLLKLLMLERRVLFLGNHNMERLTATPYAVASGLPGLMFHLQDVGLPALAYPEPAVPSSLASLNDDLGDGDGGGGVGGGGGHTADDHDHGHDSNVAPTPPDYVKLLDWVPPPHFERFHLPLRVFGAGAFFQPYLPLQQLDVLRSPETKRFWCGTSNAIVVANKALFDVIVHVDTTVIEFTRPGGALQQALALTPADRQFMDAVCAAVPAEAPAAASAAIAPASGAAANWTSDDVQFQGSDDDIRASLQNYVVHTMAAFRLDELDRERESDGVTIGASWASGPVAAANDRSAASTTTAAAGTAATSMTQEASTDTGSPSNGSSGWPTTPTPTAPRPPVLRRASHDLLAPYNAKFIDLWQQTASFQDWDIRMTFEFTQTAADLALLRDLAAHPGTLPVRRLDARRGSSTSARHAGGTASHAPAAAIPQDMPEGTAHAAPHASEPALGASSTALGAAATSASAAASAAANAASTALGAFGESLASRWTGIKVGIAAASTSVATAATSPSRLMSAASGAPATPVAASAGAVSAVPSDTASGPAPALAASALPASAGSPTASPPFATASPATSPPAPAFGTGTGAAVAAKASGWLTNAKSLWRSSSFKLAPPAAPSASASASASASTTTSPAQLPIPAPMSAPGSPSACTALPIAVPAAAPDGADASPSPSSPVPLGPPPAPLPPLSDYEVVDTPALQDHEPAERGA